jgi:CUB domain
MQVYMCGAQVPANFQLVSKTNTLTVKFHSDGSTNKPGFRAVLVGMITVLPY